MFTFFFYKKIANNLGKVLSAERGDNSKLSPCMLSDFWKGGQYKREETKEIEKGKTNKNKKPNYYFQTLSRLFRINLSLISISTWEGRMGVLVQRTEGL